MTKNKNIKKIYDTFLNEKAKKSRKSIFCIQISLVSLGIFSYFITNLIVDKLSKRIVKFLQFNLKNNDTKVCIFACNLLLISLISSCIFAFLSNKFLGQKINKWNRKIKQNDNNKNFLNYIYEKGEINNIANLIKENKKIKNPFLEIIKDILNWFIVAIIGAFAIVFGSEIITFFVFENMELPLKVVSFIGIFLIFLIKGRKQNQKPEREKELQKYLKEYHYNKKILSNILSNINNSLTIKSISKIQYEDLKKELKKIEYFYKKDKLIICIKVEYLEVYLKKEKEIEIDVENIENESKLENIDYIYDDKEKSIALIVKITE